MSSQLQEPTVSFFQGRPYSLLPLPSDPTPDQIAEGCERIRSGWSPREKRRRSAWAHSGKWTAPAVEFDDEQAVGDQ